MFTPDENIAPYASQEWELVDTFPLWLFTFLLWCVLGILGWLIFELTRNVALSLVTVCLRYALRHVTKPLLRPTLIPVSDED